MHHVSLKLAVTFIAVGIASYHSGGLAEIGVSCLDLLYATVVGPRWLLVPFAMQVQEKDKEQFEAFVGMMRVRTGIQSYESLEL